MKRIAPLVALPFLLAACAGTGSAASPAPATPEAGTEEASHPVGLDIAVIGVHATELQTAGVESDGDYRCPQDPNVIAWNADGIPPGEPGLAVIVAPAQGAFGRLGDIGPDDLIVVARADGSRANFRETAGTSTTAGARPARLQLTGCGDQAAQTVYAELVP